jgi:hypothetical protein
MNHDFKKLDFDLGFSSQSIMENLLFKFVSIIIILDEYKKVFQSIWF